VFSFLVQKPNDYVMSKLPKENQFLDLSDYGRPVAKIIAKLFLNTSATPIQVTIGFIISGFLAIYCILLEQYWVAAFFLILKSILDAADGELARLKNTPSYTGRYLDSIADFFLNLIIVLAIWHVHDGSLFLAFLAFLGIQLQGTLYNYYYVILRNKYKGDTTSRIFENKAPVAFKGEKQNTVNWLFDLYHLFYGSFDRVIYWLDPKAVIDKNLPNWFMTLVSSYGLGFQLLIIGLMLVIDLGQFVIPFFIGYSLLIFVFIPIRKIINR